MTVRVSASDLQKNFDLWHDRSRTEPVRITEQGRDTAYLVSAETFQEMWSSFRKSVSVTALSDTELTMILEADVPPEHAYDITDLDESSAPSGAR